MLKARVWIIDDEVYSIFDTLPTRIWVSSEIVENYEFSFVFTKLKSSPPSIHIDKRG